MLQDFTLQLFGHLRDGDGLPGEHSLVDDAGALDENGVRLHHGVSADGDEDDVAGDELDRRDLDV